MCLAQAAMPHRGPIHHGKPLSAWLAGSPFFIRDSLSPIAVPVSFLPGLQINVVMEYANGGSLFHYVKERGRLREPLAR